MIVESAPFPIGVYVGKEMRIQFANQSIIDIWGKGKDVIGQLYSDLLPELDNQLIFSQLDKVFSTGTSFHARNQRVDLIVQGSSKTYYFNYSFTALRDKSGNIYGVMNTAADVTDLVLEKQNVEQSEKNLNNIILQAPVAMCILLGPTHVVSLANDLIIELWGKPVAAVMNKPIFEGLPDAKGQGLEELMTMVYQTGETFKANEMPVSLVRNGIQEIVYQNFVYQPYKNSSGDILGVIATTIDVTEQVRSREVIRESEERFRTMAEDTEVLIALADESSNGIYFNKAWQDITGKSMKELMQFGWADLIHPDDKDKWLNKYLSAYKKQASVNGEFRILGKNGDYRWLYARIPARFHSDGTFAGYISSCVDITQLKNDEIRKNDFIGMVSHELKTPLTSLNALLQVTGAKLKTSEDDFLKEAIGKANVQVKRMGTMINSFLDISRLESAKIVINKEIFNLEDLLVETINETELTVSSHAINFIPCDPVLINADHDKISSVISNLLSNAVKYSPKGKTIEVKCDIIGDCAQVSIKDEGMGVKPADKKRLFERYYRVESNHTRHISGFGIGLYLSAEIIERHDGKIWVESESGKGSTFYFSIPLYIVDTKDVRN